mgnify:CR=1 FL=1
MSEQKIEAAIDYNRTHRDQFMEHYKELLRFPSISADPAYKEDVKACA